MSIRKLTPVTITAENAVEILASLVKSSPEVGTTIVAMARNIEARNKRLEEIRTQHKNLRGEYNTLSAERDRLTDKIFWTKDKISYLKKSENQMIGERLTIDKRLVAIQNKIQSLNDEFGALVRNR